LEALKPLSAALPPNLSNSSKVKDKAHSNSSSSEDTPWQNPRDSTHIWSEAATPQDVQDSTHIWSDAATPQDDAEDPTHIWSDATTPQDDAEDSTMSKKDQAEE
jgi:hypothetical protein